jgi:RNA polymerase sigma-70 factor (ECF subfamily)
LSDTTQLEAIAAALIPRAQAGDAAAREELLTRCHGTIRRWVGVLIADADDVDDVTQEVLIRVALRLETFARRARFTTWLYQVTRHTALSLRRRIARRVRLVDELPARSPTQRAPDPLAETEASEMRGMMAELFRELPERQREVFYLVDIEGHDAVAIAPQLGLRPVTVRAHLFRARRALRSKILERHPELAEGYVHDL